MEVKSLVKGKKNNYKVVIDDKEYIFDEETIVTYRLVEGKTITKQTLNKAIIDNSIQKYYQMALKYALDYAKSEDAIKEYLLNKGLEYCDVKRIVDKLKDKKIISDSNLIYSLANELARKGNGIHLIEKKLYDRKFKSELINDALCKINKNDYKEGLKALITKNKDKYNSLDLTNRRIKMKNYLLSRGYTYEDIVIVDNLIK